jgi:2,4-dienoyl-CoA reductase-like NADH-dependent reductase (Old Yellow Enzyme family)
MSPLLTPITFRSGAKAKNRIWLAPLTNLQSNEDGTLSDDELNWLLRRAEGGFGVIETCAAFVAQDGKSWPGQLGVNSQDSLEGLYRLATLLREKGSLSMVQLFHGGVRSPSAVSGSRPWSASEWKEEKPGFEVPREATLDDIKGAISNFRDAAVYAFRAGFDGVELHGAHGYLLSQFLSKTMNQRTDDWGGSLENRARLLRETLRAVRAATPRDFTVGVRISPEDFGQAKGLDLDENLQLAKWLAEDGIDFLHISLWNAHNNTQKRPSEHPVPLFRAVLPKEVRLISCGSLWTKEEAEKQLEMGADFVALGRSGIANPDWPRRAAEEGFTPERPPFSEANLLSKALSPKFVKYMRNFKGFVSDE